MGVPRSLFRLISPARLAALAAVLGTTLAVALPSAATAQPTAAAPHVIDGPSADILSLGGFSVARDGGGGLVYLKNVGGVAHVFLSRLIGGVFQFPQQVDAGLPAPSSQPVVAASNGGLLEIAFVNGGQLYVAGSTSSSVPISAPSGLAGGASNPSIAATLLGKVYLAFTQADGSGSDIRCAYYYNGQWGVESSPMNAVPADDAGTGTGRPAVAAAGDGVGIVAWGEGGHIYTRRVRGTSASIAYQQADVPSLGGWSEVSADEPTISTGGDSSYAAVAFHETLANGSQQQSRVLMQRLHAGIYDGLVEADGLSTPGPEGADQPQAASDEYGEGFVISERTSSNQLTALRLNQNERPAGPQRIDSLQNASSPDAVITGAGYHGALIAWRQDPGPLGTPDLHVRYFDGSSFDPEAVLSTPAMGPVQGSAGILAAADIAADVGVAWIQGSGASAQIVAAQMYQPPGPFGASSSFQYVRTQQPVLSWSPAKEAWGPLRYDVTVDGSLAAETTSTSVVVPNAIYPVPLGQGPHTWQVTATNPAGLTRSTGLARFFIDTVAPVVSVRLSGKRRVGSPVHVTVRYTDAPAPITPAQASGVASVQVKFGDGHSYTVRHGKFHVYHHARTYKVTVIVTDRAGNSTKVVTKVKIKARKKPRKRHHRHG